MHLIKLNATESTNSYLKDLIQTKDVDDLTTVSAKIQTNGRGQMGTLWISEPHKNLTISVLKKWLSITLDEIFLINIFVSLAIYTTLDTLGVPELSLKWPNDIMSGDSKIGGVLIENQISGKRIKSSIIGIGLNCNQTRFPENLNASSLKLLCYKDYNLNRILIDITLNLQEYLKVLDSGKSMSYFYRLYENVLFKKGVLVKFQKQNGSFFTGKIDGVTLEGRLRIRTASGATESFDLKQVKMCY